MCRLAHLCAFLGDVPGGPIFFTLRGGLLRHGRGPSGAVALTTPSVQAGAAVSGTSGRNDVDGAYGGTEILAAEGS